MIQSDPISRPKYHKQVADSRQYFLWTFTYPCIGNVHVTIIYNDNCMLVIYFQVGTGDWMGELVPPHPSTSWYVCCSMSAKCLWGTSAVSPRCSSPDTNDVSTGECRQRFFGYGRDTPAGKCQRQAYWSSSAPSTSRRSEETRLEESETMLQISYHEVIDVLDKQWKRSGLNDSMDAWIIICKSQIFI